MQTYPASENITLTVPLARNGEPFVPAGGEVAYELRDFDGEVLVAKTTLSGITDSVVNIDVLATNLSLATGNIVEKRTLLISGLVGDITFFDRVVFRISGFLNHSLAPKDVRAFIGCDDGELADNEIDIVAAYVDIYGAAGDQLELALAGAPSEEKAGNDAILARTVLNLMPSLPVRLSKSDSDGTSKVERFPIDFEQLQQRARSLLAAAMSVLTPTDSTRTLLVLTNRTDPLTGA